MKITMNKKHLLFVFVLCFIGNLFCACHKEEEIKEPTDYRDKWVGEYEHFDQNGIRNGSIFITKVYDSDTWIWLKGMGLKNAHYIDKDGNMPDQYNLMGYIHDDTLAVRHWKFEIGVGTTILLDVKCIKKKEK